METLNINEVIEKITKIIIEKINPERIVLFGSAVNEQNVSEDSDIDFLIVKETNLRRDKMSQQIRSMIKPYVYPLDIIVYTPREYEKYKNQPMSFLNSILSEGKILYERNG